MALLHDRKSLLQSLTHCFVPSRRSALSLAASVSAATSSSSSSARRLFRQDFLHFLRVRLHSERASLESSDDEEDEEEEEEDQGWLGWGGHVQGCDLEEGGDQGWLGWEGDDQGCVSDFFLLALLELSQILPEHSSQPYLQLSNPDGFLG